MNNSRINDKEWGLIKGAIRRVFSRSDLRRSVLDAATVEHKDVSRPRVTKWCKCAKCGQVVPKYTCDVDHIEPVIPIGRHMKDMSLDEAVDRIWCNEVNLQVMCGPCHDNKTKLERKLRTAANKLIREKKKVKNE